MSKLRAQALRARANGVADARVRAHKAFDELWLSGRMTRDECYSWLREVMKKTEEEGHISRFDIAECEILVEKVREKKYQLLTGSRAG